MVRHRFPFVLSTAAPTAGGRAIARRKPGRVKKGAIAGTTGRADRLALAFSPGPPLV